MELSGPSGKVGSLVVTHMVPESDLGENVEIEVKSQKELVMILIMIMKKIGIVVIGLCIQVERRKTWSTWMKKPIQCANRLCTIQTKNIWTVVKVNI